jgi:hypothetical protein
MHKSKITEPIIHCFGVNENCQFMYYSAVSPWQNTDKIQVHLAQLGKASLGIVPRCTDGAVEMEKHNRNGRFFDGAK